MAIQGLQAVWYVLPVVFSSLSEQQLSREEKDFEFVSLCLLAMTPVPAERPTTAAYKTAMTIESRKTSIVHPHTVLLFFVKGVDAMGTEWPW